MLKPLVVVLLAAAVPEATQEDDAPPAWSLGVDLDWSLSSSRDTTLNRTHYDNDLTRLLRVALRADFRLSRRSWIHVNLTSENGAEPHLYGAFVRLAPWGEGRVWLQAGKMPPAFGAFPERWYALANPLVGYPLMYQHRTTLRPDVLPRDADELLAQRGNGRAPRYGGAGNAFARAGMPMVSLLRWDSGAVVFGTAGRLDYVGGVTNGTMSNPLVEDRNDGKQLLGRLRLRLPSGLELGGSVARGPYLDRAVEPGLGGARLESFHQTLVGTDVRFARGHWIVDAEAALSRWEHPVTDRPLAAIAAFVELRYKIGPGLYAAGRVDGIDFSRIGTPGRPWDAPLRRVELGAGYSWERNVLVKLAVQSNRFRGAPELDEDLVAFQLALRF